MRRAAAEGGPGRFEERMRKRAEEMMERVPQTPFMMVIRSARRKFLETCREDRQKMEKEYQ